jgi:hypothetical protein
MRNLIVIVAVILLLPSMALSADPWTQGDLWREIAWQTLHIVDWGQTLEIADNPSKYHEHNIIMGRHPKKHTVNEFMAVSAMAHIAIAHVLPSKWRLLWQTSTIAATGYCVGRNFNIGVGIKF